MLFQYGLKWVFLGNFCKIDGIHRLIHLNGLFVWMAMFITNRLSNVNYEFRCGFWPHRSQCHYKLCRSLQNEYEMNKINCRQKYFRCDIKQCALYLEFVNVPGIVLNVNRSPVVCKQMVAQSTRAYYMQYEKQQVQNFKVFFWMWNEKLSFSILYSRIQSKQTCKLKWVC